VARNTRQLSDHPVGVRNGMQHMPANRKIETPIGGTQPEDALVLERQPGTEIRVARSCQIQMVVDDVHAEHGGSREKCGQP
jgi:hypothetical protein